MTRVYIAQVKCPQDHCVLGAAGVYGSIEDALELLGAVLARTMDRAVKYGLLNRKCPICGSTDLRVETARTIFRTIEEAREPIAQLAAEQQQTAAALKAGKN